MVGGLGVCAVFGALDGFGALDVFGVLDGFGVLDVFGVLDGFGVLDSLVVFDLDDLPDLGDVSFSAELVVCDDDVDGRTFCLATRYTYDPSRLTPDGEIYALMYSPSVPFPPIRNSRVLIATTAFGCNEWRGLNGNCAKCTRRSFDRFPRASVFVSTVTSDMSSKSIGSSLIGITLNGRSEGDGCCCCCCCGGGGGCTAAAAAAGSTVAATVGTADFRAIGSGGGGDKIVFILVEFAVVIVIDVELLLGGVNNAGGAPITDTVLMLHVVYDVTFMPYSIMYCRSFISDWIALFLRL